MYPDRRLTTETVGRGGGGRAGREAAFLADRHFDSDGLERRRKDEDRVEAQRGGGEKKKMCKNLQGDACDVQ